MKFHVPEMSCNHCTAAIDKAITAADAGAKVKADLDSKIVEIASTLDAASLRAVLEKAGYPATPA